MKLPEDIRSVTYLKSRAADLLDQVNETRRPVVITQTGKPRAVVLDPESYGRMRDAIGLLKLVAQGERDLRARRVTGQAVLWRGLEARLGRRGRGDAR